MTTQQEKPFHKILSKAMWNFTIVYAMLCLAGLLIDLLAAQYI